MATKDFARPDRSLRLRDAQKWVALGAGALLLTFGAYRRSKLGALSAATAVPLLYRGITGHWPTANDRGDTKRALVGDRGTHVRAAMRVDLPIDVVYAFWRRLENLPRFMTHLERVTESSDLLSHWVARGPGGLAVEWDAEIINEIENELLAWKSLAGSDVVMAGSVNFTAVDEGRSTEVRVHLQYAPPGGKGGTLLATFLGENPAETIRADMHRFKDLIEARGTPTATGLG